MKKSKKDFLILQIIMALMIFLIMNPILLPQEKQEKEKEKKQDLVQSKEGEKLKDVSTMEEQIGIKSEEPLIEDLIQESEGIKGLKQDLNKTQILMYSMSVDFQEETGNLTGSIIKLNNLMNSINSELKNFSDELKALKTRVAELEKAKN